MKKTLIIYAPSMFHAALVENILVPAKEAGQSVRLVGSEFFRGDAETNAAGVAVLRHGDDEELFANIEATYPELEVRSFSEKDAEKALKIDLADVLTPRPNPPEDELREAREELVKLGGSVPAGADIDKLRELIAEQKLIIAKTGQSADQRAANVAAGRPADAAPRTAPTTGLTEKGAEANAKADAAAKKEGDKK